MRSRKTGGLAAALMLLVVAGVVGCAEPGRHLNNAGCPPWMTANECYGY